MAGRFVLVAILAACGGGGDGEGGVDATPPPDAPPPAPVVALASCPSSVDAMIEDSASAFIPNMVTVDVGGVVRISTTSEHFVIPNISRETDPALMVGRAETKCFRFNAAGSYGIACGVHGFAATITVQ